MNAETKKALDALYGLATYGYDPDIPLDHIIGTAEARVARGHADVSPLEIWSARARALLYEAVWRLHDLGVKPVTEGGDGLLERIAVAHEAFGSSLEELRRKPVIRQRIDLEKFYPKPDAPFPALPERDPR